MSIHDGHRQRLKDRFCKEGLDHFEEHQVLELLLFYCIPRVDTNPIAHALPSDADIQTTRRVALALDAVEIGLVDHIIVADNDFVSLADSGYFA